MEDGKKNQETVGLDQNCNDIVDDVCRKANEKKGLKENYKIKWKEKKRYIYIYCGSWIHYVCIYKRNLFKTCVENWFNISIYHEFS